MNTLKINIKKAKSSNIFFPLNTIKHRKEGYLVLVIEVYMNRFIGTPLNGPHKGIPVDGINDPNLYEQFVGTIELTYP